MTCFFYLPRVYTKKFIISQNLVQKYATKLTFPSFFNSSSAVMNQRMLKQVGTATSSSAVHDALEVPSGWLLGKGLQTDTQHPPNTHFCNKKITGTQRMNFVWLMVLVMKTDYKRHI